MADYMNAQITTIERSYERDSASEYMGLDDYAGIWIAVNATEYRETSENTY